MEDFKLATILCMTSASESFGLVLVEAMSYGVIPFAFNSFPAVTDIIQNGINGFLVEPFDIEQYAERLLTFCLVSDKEKSKIAEELIKEGYEVIVLDNFFLGTEKNLKNVIFKI